MPDALMFVAAGLAVWRVSHLIAEEDGPGDVVARVRSRLGEGAVRYAGAHPVVLKGPVSGRVYLFDAGATLDVDARDAPGLVQGQLLSVVGS